MPATITGYHSTHRSREQAIAEHGYGPSGEEEWLGKGAYFFEDAPFCAAKLEARGFAEKVRKIPLAEIVVFRSTINPKRLLDLAYNRRHRALYHEARDRLRLKVALEDRQEPKELDDYRVFALLDSQANSFDVVRAIVDAERIGKGYQTYLVRRPQLQVCVKDNNAIRSSEVCWRYTQVRRLRKWDTPKDSSPS